jgi:hypothetical protein
MVSGWAVAPWARVDGLIPVTVGWASMVVALTALTALKVTPGAQGRHLGGGGGRHRPPATGDHPGERPGPLADGAWE